MIYIPPNPLAQKKAKKSKFKNKKVESLGRKFDSIIERDRFHFLMDEKKRGTIRNLQCQVPFKLDVCGSHICKYIADFTYQIACEKPWDMSRAIDDMHMDEEWITIVEDVKGGYKKLPVFALKEKLMKAIHNIEIKIVKSATLPI